MNNKIPRLVGVALTLAIAVGACSSSGESIEGLVLDPAEATTTAVAETPTPEAQVTAMDLQSSLDAIVIESGVPAIGAAIFDGDGVLDIAVSGVRQRGEDTEVTIDDRFHIGSNTKALTAVLLARLEEQGGAITSETTVSEAFPNIAIHADYDGVTMAELMRHSGGVPFLDGIPDDIRDLPVVQARAAGADLLLSEPSAIPAGTLAQYSNSNYVLVGVALEAATGQSWEELMTTQVFEPLGMDSCGFGAPGVEGEDNEPRGHDSDGDAMFGDNPPLLGPAGTAHCSMADWGTVLVELLNGFKGESDFLTQESVQRLFEPNAVPIEGMPNGHNALGWVVLDGPQGDIYWHNGSNTFWYSQAIIDPAADRVILAVTNEAPTGAQAADMALAVLTADLQN